MRKLPEAQEELGIKHKLMGDILEEAGPDRDFNKVKSLGDGDSQSKVEKFRELNTELTALTTECKKLELVAAGEMHTLVQDQLDRPVLKGVEPGASPVGAGGGGPGGLSVGRMFVGSDAYKSFLENPTSGFAVKLPDVELKTLMETSGGWAPFSPRTDIVVPARTRPIQALDLIPMGGTTAPSVIYMEETLRTHAAAERMEGTAAPESAFELTEKAVQVRKIADSIPVTDEQLEDVAQLESYLNQRLSFGLRQRLDNQVINGTGTAPNLNGILNVAGIQTQARGVDPRFDAIHKAMTLVRVTGRAIPGGIVMHPNDWQEIRLTRTADGIYILGNPASDVTPMLFGVPVAQGDLIVENTALVGDFANFCQLFEKRGVQIEVGTVGSQFTEGRKTLRADMRVAFVVFRPEAFCSVTGL